MEPWNMKMPATEEQKSLKSHDSLCSLPSRKLCLKKKKKLSTKDSKHSSSITII